MPKAVAPLGNNNDNTALHFKARVKSAVLDMRKTPNIAKAGVLSALGIALNQVTFVVSTMLEIGFSFLATATISFMYGPFLAAIAAVAMDFVGYMLRPNGGFFIGYTFNEVLSALIYGFWLYKKPVKLWRTFFACLSIVLIINLFFTPLWLNIQYGNAFVLSSVRLIKNVIKLPVDSVLLYTVLLMAQKSNKRSLYTHK